MLGNVETSAETVEKVAMAMLAIVQDNNWLARENTRLQELVTSMEKTIADQLYRNNVRRDTIADLQCSVSEKDARITELESELEKVRGMYKALRAADVYRRDLLKDDENQTADVYRPDILLADENQTADVYHPDILLADENPTLLY